MSSSVLESPKVMYPLTENTKTNIKISTGVHTFARILVGYGCGAIAAAQTGMSASFIAPAFAVQGAASAILGGILEVVARKNGWKVSSLCKINAFKDVLLGIATIITCLALGVLTPPVAGVIVGITCSWSALNFAKGTRGTFRGDEVCGVW